MQSDAAKEGPRKPRYSKRRWALEADKHRAILKLLKHGVGVCTTASIVGVGVRTVQRRKALLEQETNEQIASEDRLPTEEVVSFKAAKRSQTRCPIHGPVTVWPCVACAAQAARVNGPAERAKRPRAS